MLRHSIIIFLGLFIIGTALAQDVYQVDTKSSTAEWTARKVTGRHHGTIQIKNGSLQFTGDRLTGGEFKIDMQTIKDVDLEDPKWNAKLIGHLKSPDFFDVENHPVATFKITHVQNESGAEGNNYFVRGDLTIKGHTNAIEFLAAIAVTDGQLTAKAHITVDRAKFDVRYGSGSFFEGLGDKLIYDDFDLDVNLVAKK